MFRPGDLIAQFVIVAPLGQGGMGQVFVARDSRLNRQVALKILHLEDELPPDPSFESGSKRSDGAARLLREAQSAAALEHPNVVTIYDVGEVVDADGRACPFIAMELVKGKTLRTYVGDASVPMAERIRWVTDIVRALAAAHDAGLVHRDIKPENVMIREDGTVKVLDFGLAKRASRGPVSSSSSTEAQVLPSITAKGVAVGTPYYMAPEQMRREDLDGRADQFSWGVLAYELLSGEPPWGRDVDALELVSKLLSVQPPELAQVRPEVPAHVAAAVMRALAKKRADRFDTTRELVEVLEGKPGRAPAADAFAPTMPRIPTMPSPAMREGASPLAESVDGKTGVGASVGAQLKTVKSSRPPPPDAGPSRRVLGVAAAALVVVAAGFGVRALMTRTPATSGTASGAAPIASAAPHECETHTQCVRKLGGKPAVCNAKGACALVESDRCKASFEPRDLERDDTVWVGAMFPLSGGNEVWGRPCMNSVELARRDFAQAFETFRPPPGTLPVPPLAVVGCDDAASADVEARHLVDEVSSPAVIGFSSSTETIDLASSTFIPAGVMTIASTGASPLITSIPHGPEQPRLVWRTTYSTAASADAMAAVVAALEAEIRGARHLPSGDEIRVVQVRRAGPAPAAAAEAIFRALRFNGRSALENVHAYKELVLVGNDDLAAKGAELAGMRPDIVVGASGLTGELLEATERGWPRSVPNRPRYLPFVLDPTIVRFIGKSADRRHRVLSLNAVSTTNTNARFVAHYNDTFPQKITRSESPNTVYDGFYLAALAAYALAGKPVTGESLARAVARLVPPGVPVDVGPTGILPALAALEKGENVDLEGATGRMDFDRTTGEAPLDFAVVCADVDANGQATAGVESGVVYEAANHRLTATPRCP